VTPPLLIALDLDGTLLDDDHGIRARTRHAVGRCLAGGAFVVLCTGRPPRMTHAFAAHLGLDMAIVYNGASRYSAARRTSVHHHQLDPDRALAVVMRLRANAAGVGLGLETARGWFLDATLFEAARERLAAAGLPDPDDVGDVERFLEGGAIKVFARHAEHDVEALARHVRDLDVYATWSGPGLLEVMHPAVNKREALERLAAELDIPRTRVAAFGDNHNDVQMLAWAGHGVAVANATPAARAAADEVTSRNVDEGVAAVLERWYP